MSKTFRPWDVRQDFLLPPSLLDWLPEHHLARFVLEVVEELDLRPIYEPYEKELRGFPPYEPKMMVALLLYAYCMGVTSSRKIERKTQEDVAFRVLAANQSPDHSRISDFRCRHGVHFENLFVQVLKLCVKAGLVKLGHVALRIGQMGALLRGRAGAERERRAAGSLKYGQRWGQSRVIRKIEGLLRVWAGAEGPRRVADGCEPGCAPCPWRAALSTQLGVGPGQRKRPELLRKPLPTVLECSHRKPPAAGSPPTVPK